MKTNPGTVLLLAAVSLFAANSCALAHTDVTAQQARDLIDSTSDLIVVDVREPSEYCNARGHIPGALNYPWNSGVLRARYEELPADGPILVVCQSGGRSNAAASFLDSNGFSIVYDMLRGMSAWLWETAPCKYSGGSGTPDDPYRIATADDLIALGKTPEDYDKHFILTADIDLDPSQSAGVFDKAIVATDTDNAQDGFQGTPFTGVFDGNGHDISHMTIKGEGYLGLFGQLGSGATIQNVGLDAAQVYGTGDCVGGLAGSNNGSITDSYSTGTVDGNQNVGGLVGINNASIKTCYSTTTVTGMGWLDADVGGLAGANTGSAVIAGSYSTSMVTGRGSAVGGLVGRNSGAVTQCYSTAAATGYMYVGGLVGSSWGTITASYSTGRVMGNHNVGGLVGSANRPNITSSLWNVETSGQTTSDGGTGLTTAEMQAINTYLNAGWDFVDEVLNGTCDYWQISTGEYPRLHYHFAESPVMPEGSGTAQQPYLIRHARDLGTVWFKPLAHYHLDASLDLSGIMWSEAVVPWFGGTFVGNDYVISNLHIEGGGRLGLFGQLQSGTEVRDLGVVDVNIAGSGDDVGGLAGINNGNISMSHSTGTVSGDERVGGLTGSNYLGTITASHSTATVMGGGRPFSSSVGGLTGENSGRINRSYSTGTVGGGSYEVAGLVGRNSGAVIDCNSTCSVTGDYLVGGLVGDNYGAVFTCYGACSVTGLQYVGGLVGRNVGNMINCYSTGEVVGNEAIGGLVGINGYCIGAMAHPGYIDKSYSLASVRGEIFVGGLVGDNWAGDVTQCYSKGAVNGGSYVGGLVGQHGGTVTQCYSTGAVSGDKWVGGLVGGEGEFLGVVFHSVWDVETSGQATSAGGTGLTTPDMQTAGTFLDAGWGFIDETANGADDIWSILEGQDYPRLYWEFIGGIPSETPSVLEKASDPYPADGAVDVEESWSGEPFKLAWIAGAGAIAHNVYFGTDFDTVSQSNIDSIPGALIFQNLAASELRLWTLERDKTYYWRIDEVGSDGTIVAGDVWSFTTALRPSFWKGRACFTGDTPVWIDGNLIPISKAVSGQVIRYGDDQNIVEELQVHNGTFTCYDIVLETGNCITVAECHYLMTDSGQWLAVQDLKTGTRLKTAKGHVSVTTIARRPKPHTGKVFNLKIKGSDHYTVGADAIVVRDY